VGDDQLTDAMRRAFNAARAEGTDPIAALTAVIEEHLRTLRVPRRLRTPLRVRLYLVEYFRQQAMGVATSGSFPPGLILERKAREVRLDDILYSFEGGHARVTAIRHPAVGSMLLIEHRVFGVPGSNSSMAYTPESPVKLIVPPEQRQWWRRKRGT
jgi:hypothetical protein